MKNPINFFDAELIGNELWFSNLNFNALMKTNLSNGYTEMVSVFNDAEPFDENLHIKVIRHNELLFFIPYVGNVVHIWNTEKNHFEESIKLECAANCQWVNAYKDCNNAIWLIPENLAVSIVIIDVQNRTSSKSAVTDYIFNMANMKECTVGTKCVDYYNNVLYIQLYKKNICFYVDCNTGDVNKIVFPNSFMPTSFRVYNENTFYLYLNEGAHLYEWDNKQKEFTELNPDIPLVRGRTLYWDMVRIGYKIIFIPCHGNDLLVYDIETKSTDKIELPESFCRCSPYALFGSTKEINGNLYLFPRGGNELVSVNTNSYTSTSISFILSNELADYSNKIINSIFEKQYSLEVNEAYAFTETMDMFLEKLISTNVEMETCQKSDAGSSIHQYIMNGIK